MTTVIPSSANKLVLKLAAEVTTNGSRDMVTFDAVIQDFELGRNLHSLFTNPVSSPSDIALREKLAGYGITYDVVKINTIRKRANSPENPDHFPISEFKQMSKKSTKKKKQNNPAVSTPTRTSKSNPQKKIDTPKKSTSKSKPSAKRNTPTKKTVAKKSPTKPNSATTKTKPKSPKFDLDKAKSTYTQWVSLVGVRGVNELLEKAKPQEGTKDSDLPENVSIGNLEFDRKSILNVTEILIKSGDLIKRGVHGYVPTGKLDATTRAIAEHKRYL